MFKFFPGMDPYLEQPNLWPQVHNRLIVAIADELTPQIAPHYRVSIEERIYTSTEQDLRVGIADIAIRDRTPKLVNINTTKSALADPVKVHVPLPIEIKERFLQVRVSQTGEVVCVIEILSPANKRGGKGRSTYERKRQQILGSQTSLVEIDLLKQGQPMPLIEETDSRYRVLVSRGYSRPEADLYPFRLQDPIPTFPVPLRKREAEPLVDLQRLLDEVYDRARFDLAIDYSLVPSGILSKEEREWVVEIRARGVDPL